MASLELGKLSTYDLVLSENCKDIYYVKLTDSLYKTLEDYHVKKNKGQIQLTVNKVGRGGIIEVENERSTSRYNFKCGAISNKTGLDCLKQTQSSPGLALVGTASTRLIIQATEDVYQSTREKLALAEEKKNENQTVMIASKFKRKSLHAAKLAKMAENSESASSAPSALSAFSSAFSKPIPQTSIASKPPRTVPTFKASSSIVNDSKAQRQLRERAIHILALRPHRKIELLSKLQENGSKSKDGVTKILAQISNTQNNMFHLKSFLYGEVQVDTWADYSASDRTTIRQQLKLHGIEKSPEAEVVNKEVEDQQPKPKPEQPKPEMSKKVEQFISSAPKFVKQSVQPPPKPEKFAKQSQPPKQDKFPKQPPKEDQTTLISRSRKRSSSDDTKSSKKQCREVLKETGDVNGVNVNAVSRRAASELRMPFVESVKVEIAQLQKNYVTIATPDQKIAYAEDFHRDYEEYLQLKKREKEVGLQFAGLKASYDRAEKKSPEFKSITRKTRDLFKQYMSDSNWCRDKERLLKLEAKLSHIKQLFKQYDERGS